jgi:hypothetical protein
LLAAWASALCDAGRVATARLRTAAAARLSYPVSASTTPTTALTIRDATDDDSYDVIGLVASCWAEYTGCVIDMDAEPLE